MLPSDFEKIINQLEPEYVSNTVRIKFNDFIFQIYQPANSLHVDIFAGIGILEHESRLALLKWIAAVNLMGHKTNGGYVGLQEKSNIIVFSSRIDIKTITKDDFLEIINQFSKTLSMLIVEYHNIANKESNANFNEDMIINDLNIYSV